MERGESNTVSSVRIDAGFHLLTAPAAEIYFVRKDAAGRSGTRRYLGTLRKGDLCQLLPSDRYAGGSMVFRFRGSGTLLPVKIGSGGRCVPGKGLERWLHILAASPQKGLHPKSVQPAVAGERVMLQEHDVLMAGSEILWVQIHDGSAYFYGRRSRTAQIERGPWPLMPNTWLLMREASDVEVMEGADVVNAGAIAPALIRFNELTLRLLAHDARTVDAAEVQRLKASEAADRQQLSVSLRDLISILEVGDGPPASGDPLSSAVRRVAEDQGIEVRDTRSDRALRTQTRLRELARTNGFRMRRVALRGAWWQSEVGPLLGSWMPERGQTPRPVSIRPGRRHKGPAIWDPETGDTFPLNEDTAARLAPFAYAFYRPMPERADSIWSLLQFGLRHTAVDIWLLVLLGITAGGLATAVPVLTGKIYDLAIPEAALGQAYQIAALLASVAVAAALFQFVRAIAMVRLETRLDGTVQSGVWDHLLALPVGFFRHYTAGDLATRAGGVEQIRQLMSAAATTALLTGIFSAWYLGLMFYYDARLAGWVTVGVAAATAASIWLAILQLRHQRVATLIHSALSGMVLELIRGVAKLRVAGAEARAFARWARKFAAQRRSYVSGRRYGNLLVMVQSALPLSLLMIAYGLTSVGEAGSLSTGEFLAFHTALLSFAGASVMIANVFTAGASALPLYEQLRPILACRRESHSGRTDPGELSGEVEIRHVSFAYASDEPPVIDDISIRIKPGEFVALVGPSGSGKSSLLRLLLGFESPSSGSIYFDGQDMSGLDLHGLRNQFGVVLQDAGVLAGDVYTNIAGSSDATLEDAWEAARLAGLADDIKEMPMGMHTVINEGGTTISGGQRQRLMIARAIVTKPRILLFDEATSALDNVTQGHVSASLANLNATRIVVAHRLTTIMDADRIYVLDRGRMVEDGTYGDLMAREGLFYRLARRQMMETVGET